MPSKTSLYFPRPKCCPRSQFALGHTTSLDCLAGSRTDLADNLIVLQYAPTCSAHISAIAKPTFGVARQLKQPWRGLFGRQAGHTDVDAIIVPVCSRHVLVDICVDPRHIECGASVRTYLPSGKRAGDEAAEGRGGGGGPPTVERLDSSLGSLLKSGRDVVIF